MDGGIGIVQPAGREWRVKYDGVCARCGVALLKGTVAVWDRSTKTMRCVECPTGDSPPPPIDAGAAGASATREYERRMARRDAAARAKWGDRVGGLVVRMTEAPQSTRAWAIGAAGEEKLAEALADVPGLRALHDRRVPGTRGNVDHVFVAPAGVFVVDAKKLAGMIRVRSVGPFWRREERLFVGGRDKSKLAEAMAWQVEAVRSALASEGIDPLPPITPVLCFIDGEWPLLFPPESYRRVRLEGPGSLRRLVTSAETLDAPSVDRVAAALARALPSK